MPLSGLFPLLDMDDETPVLQKKDDTNHIGIVTLNHYEE